MGKARTVKAVAWHGKRDVRVAVERDDVPHIGQALGDRTADPLARSGDHVRRRHEEEA